MADTFNIKSKGHVGCVYLFHSHNISRTCKCIWYQNASAFYNTDFKNQC